MTTWISKSGLGLTAMLALAGCEAGQGPAGLLSALSKPDDTAAAPAQEVVALSQTQMANGAFTLKPPTGFCIDQSTLSQRFALMARCDGLGAPSKAAGAPVGIVTVSVTRLGKNQPLPTPQETADAIKLARFDAVKSEVGAVTFRAEGPPPVPGMDIKHWRGSVRIGDQLLALALYGPTGGRAETSEGREILNDLIRRTREASG